MYDIEYINKSIQQRPFSNDKSTIANQTCQSENFKVDNKINQLFTQKKTIKISKQLEKITIADFQIQFDDQENIQELLYNSQNIENLESSRASTHSEEQYKININCPYCGINTTTIFDSTPLAFPQLKKKYFFHKACYEKLSAQMILCFKNSPTFPDAIIKTSESTNTDFYLNQHLNLQYYHGQLTICHPLSNFIYLQIQKKIAIQNQILNWSFFNQNPIPFYPNIICLPFLEFKVRLTIEIHGILMVYEFLINLNQFQNRYQSRKFMACATSIDAVILEGEIIQNKEKKIFVEKMNYKYNYYNITTPMVKLNNIKFKIPPFYQNKLCQIIQYYYPHQYITYNQQPTVQQYCNYDTYQNYNNNLNNSTQQFNTTIPQVVDEYSDIYDAIAQKQVDQYVKTNTGSRLCQRFLKKCSQQNLQYFISAVYPILPKLVVCPYGNYTFQQLINVCPPQKKRILIAKLGENIPELAKTKQGTHALQTLISSVTFQNQIQLIKQSIFYDILDLSKDNNGTHFIKKILIYFGNSSYKHVQFIHLDIVNNFLEYCTDGNGVLVVKALMNQIKQVDLMRNQLIAKIEYNLETIIQDPYGNYVVQQAYILFKQLKVKGITSKIIEKFVSYSVNKFASNVIINCLQQYCGNEFYKAVEAMFIKIKNYQDMPKNVSGQHILKLLYMKSQNKIFIEDIRSTIPKEKMEKLGWEINTPKNQHDQKKQAQTVKIQNKSNFGMAVAEIKLGPNNNFKKKINGNETTTNNSGTFTPSLKKNEIKSHKRKS